MQLVTSQFSIKPPFHLPSFMEIFGFLSLFKKNSQLFVLCQTFGLLVRFVERKISEIKSKSWVFWDLS